MIIYEGPSQLDGAPIVAIATGTKRASANPKTGRMAQIWILRQDVAPTEAVKTGADSSICGDCTHRGGIGKPRTCYVQVPQAPQTVWRTYKAGRYAAADPAEALAGHAVRMSAYGDPAALPLPVVEATMSRASGWTGYTHQWRRAPELAAWLMASVESDAERIAARIAGFRTFRAREKAAPLSRGEIECLSDSAGITCAACNLCAGQSRPGKRDISIQVHGSAAKHFRATA